MSDPHRGRDNSHSGIALVPTRSWWVTFSPDHSLVAVEIPFAKGWNAGLASSLHRCTGHSSKRRQPKNTNQKNRALRPPVADQGQPMFL